MQTIPPITLERTQELLTLSIDELDTIRLFLKRQAEQYDLQARSKGIGQDDVVNMLNTSTLHGEVCRILQTKGLEDG